MVAIDLNQLKIEVSLFVLFFFRFVVSQVRLYEKHSGNASFICTLHHLITRY